MSKFRETLSLAMKTTGNEVIASVFGSLAATAEYKKDENIPAELKDVRIKPESIEKRANFL